MNVYLYIFVLIFHCQGHLSNRVADYQNDYSLLTFDSEQEPLSQYPTSEIISPKTGSDVILNCKSFECHRNKIMWEFAACRPCQKYKHLLEWKQKNVRKKCVAKLHLKNITLTESGLYKCTVKNVTIKQYEVDVIESFKFEGDPPKLIDVIPRNSTLKPQTSIVIQCKVLSLQVPIILWLKQIEGNSTYDIQYADQFYKRINTSNKVYPMSNEEFIYISKLNIQNVTNSDAGLYVCVVVTELGKDYKHFSIQIVQNRFYKEASTMNLSVLFLIPLVFILIPICVWLCYYKKKKRRLRNDLKQENVLIERNQPQIISQI